MSAEMMNFAKYLQKSAKGKSPETAELLEGIAQCALDACQDRAFTAMAQREAGFVKKSG